MAADKKYVMKEWKSGAEMHEDARLWVSELEFITSEHHFFEDLLATYFMKISNKDHFRQGKDLVEELEENRQKNQRILEDVTAHNNRLIVLLDGKNEFEKEDRVKEEHRDLELQMQEHHEKFRMLKAHIFSLIGEIIKEIRREHLLGP
ncbi:hypothetical protein [Robertkochia flava]|uniref:hypothetical protein n=1 Tax=Robertkochia flava TaxID=3447986 RepID=UPI001CCE2551|nr:hypothetical protein [Robertkochia marina]